MTGGGTWTVTFNLLPSLLQEAHVVAEGTIDF